MCVYVSVCACVRSVTEGVIGRPYIQVETWIVRDSYTSMYSC